MTDPFALFDSWFADARETEINDSNAMVLATVDSSGMPSLRMVLLKGHDATGFVFYTNLGSRKANDLATNPQAALLFHWKSLRRQIRISGQVSAVDDAAADAYFASRHRDSQLGAWASLQSQPLPDRDTFMARHDHYAEEFANADVPRPPHWSGFRIAPERFEFWEDREYRLHHRRVFIPAQSGWSEGLLYP